MSSKLVLNRTRKVPAEDTAAFGAIAERFRRAGALDRAVQLCREGLQKFPDHISARATLGWSLLDLGQYDEARVELETVLRKAPDNLAAIRGLAELHDRFEHTLNLPMDGPGQWPPPPETVDASAKPYEDAASAFAAVAASDESIVIDGEAELAPAEMGVPIWTPVSSASSPSSGMSSVREIDPSTAPAVFESEPEAARAIDEAPERNQKQTKPSKKQKQEREARERAEKEQRAREEQAREQEAREKAAREEAAREQTAREQAAREQQAREEREQRAREEQAREQEARDRAAREQEEREQAVREQAARELEQREQAAREQREREQREREQRDQEVREQAARDQEARERAACEQAAREQDAREQAARELAAREAEAREQTARELAAREAEAREQAARELAAREAEARELAAREAEAREHAAREKEAREQQAREHQERERLERERLEHERQEQERAQQLRLEQERLEQERLEEQRLEQLRQQEAAEAAAFASSTATDHEVTAADIQALIEEAEALDPALRQAASLDDDEIALEVTDDTDPLVALQSAGLDLSPAPAAELGQTYSSVTEPMAVEVDLTSTPGFNLATPVESDFPAVASDHVEAAERGPEPAIAQVQATAQAAQSAEVVSIDTVVRRSPLPRLEAMLARVKTRRAELMAESVA